MQAARVAVVLTSADRVPVFSARMPDACLPALLVGPVLFSHGRHF